MRRTATSDELYFLTLTIVGWVDIFTRPEYKEYIIDNLVYCNKNKGLEVFEYVIMSNHIHLLARRKKGMSMSDWLRDFKSYTSKGLYKLIAENERESRRDWMLQIFNAHGENNELNKDFQIWQNGSHPTCLPMHYTDIIQQKTAYIHLNPVRAGLVPEPGMYLYSSAHLQNPYVLRGGVMGSSEDA